MNARHAHEGEVEVFLRGGCKVNTGQWAAARGCLGARGLAQRHDAHHRKRRDQGHTDCQDFGDRAGDRRQGTSRDAREHRSATGFLEAKEFEATADQFFAHPTKSIRGWETAVRAQVRIVTEVEAALSELRGNGDVLFVGHGAVATLLYCHYARLAISRKHDQPAGGGNYFTVRLKGREVRHMWRAMEPAPSSQLAT